MDGGLVQHGSAKDLTPPAGIPLSHLFSSSLVHPRLSSPLGVLLQAFRLAKVILTKT